MAKRIVINACAARYGGAKTIVDSYLNWLSQHNNDDQFLLLAPDAPDALPLNVTFVRKETSGLATLLFCCIGVLFYCLRFRASHCLSFNNVNLLLPVCKRITYFHQAKVFTERSLRFRVIGAAITLLRGSKVILQSPLIKERFQAFFSAHYQLDVKWPGITDEPPLQRSRCFPLEPGKITLLWPVTDPFVPQKNFHWIKQHQQWFIDNNVQLLIPAEAQTQLPFVTELGGMPRAELFELYRQVDGVIIVSTEETLCLPIFEAASQGTRVWVLRQPYIEAIVNWRGLPPQVSLFNVQEDISLYAETKDNEIPINPEYYRADWQIH